MITLPSRPFCCMQAPVLAVLAFGVYCAVSLLYGVATFKTVPEEAESLAKARLPRAQQGMFAASREHRLHTVVLPLPELHRHSKRAPTEHPARAVCMCRSRCCRRWRWLKPTLLGAASSWTREEWTTSTYISQSHRTAHRVYIAS